MLSQPSFMPKGGTLAFYCAHRYAHNAYATRFQMPYALKGVDAVLYAVFEKLGMKVRVRPILENRSIDMWGQTDSESEDEGGSQRRIARVGRGFHALRMVGGEYMDDGFGDVSPPFMSRSCDFR